MVEAHRRRTWALVLVTPDGRPTQDFIDEWEIAGAQRPLASVDRVATQERTPTVEFLARWRAAWGPSPLRAINPAFVMFDEVGKFTPLGYARWVAAIRP